MIAPVGTGIYTPAEAAALLHEKPTTVLRWAFGYTRIRPMGAVEHPPLIATELPEMEGRRALTFLELVELMYVRGFQRAGAPWHLIKEAARVAARLYQTEHPFAARAFLADPRGIYAVLKESGERESLVQLVGHGQYAFADFVKPYLGQLEFGVNDMARRWWPMGKEGRVSIDPRSEFGAPVVEEVGIRTKVLSDAYYAEKQAGREDAVERVAWLYGVRADHVETALRFKHWLQAA